MEDRAGRGGRRRGRVTTLRVSLLTGLAPLSLSSTATSSLLEPFRLLHPPSTPAPPPRPLPCPCLARSRSSPRPPVYLSPLALLAALSIPSDGLSNPSLAPGLSHPHRPLNTTLNLVSVHDCRDLLVCTTVAKKCYGRQNDTKPPPLSCVPPPSPSVSLTLARSLFFVGSNVWVA